MAIIIGGGTGFVGKALRSIIPKAESVFIITRQPKNPNDIRWDELKTKLPKYSKAIVALQGETVLQPFAHLRSGFYERLISSRVETLNKINEAIEVMEPQERPRVLVSMSGVGFYRPSRTEEYTEKSEGGDDFLANLVRKWEAASKPIEGVRHVILRTGVVLGRNGGFVQSVYWPYFFGLGGPFGSGEQYLPWIHVTDLARIIQTAIESDKISGVYNAVAPQIIKQKDFAKAFAGSFKPPRPSFIPIANPIVRMMFGDNLNVVVLEGQKVFNEKLTQIGFKYEYPDIEKACASLHECC